MSVDKHLEPAQNCDIILELIPEYAFGLTSIEEARLVESNLPFCPEAVIQLADYQRLQTALRDSVPQLEPPSQLAERLMTAIATPAAETKPRRRILPLSWLVAVAAVLALIMTNGLWLLRVNDLMRRQAEMAAQIPTQTSKAFILTGTSNLRWVRLPPSQAGADTSAFMMWNAESEIGLLYAHGFPKLAVGKTYQLWLTRGDERANAGTFRVDADGKGALLFHISGPIDQFTWARITAEPENGSSEPTGSPVVVGKLGA
jgi:hypothetical protein